MDLEAISAYLRDTDKIIITTHEAPDGDGLGAEYALCSSLLDLGKTVQILNSDISAHKYRFFDEKQLIHTRGVDGELPDDLENWTLVVLDTEPTNIGAMASEVLNHCKDVVVIDHHSPKTKGSLKGWLVPDSSSTCEMVFRILEHLRLGFKRDVAVALYTGIVYDTGSFIYPKTQARTFRIAETLVSSGAVPNEVFTQLFESKSTGALMLQSLVTSTMNLRLGERVAFQIMPRETLIASGASYDESQEIVNIPLQSRNVRVSVFLKEDERGIRRCSIRSKGEVDCAAIAQSFNGGGHKTAAGFSFTQSFGDVQDEVLESIRPYFP